MKRSRFIPKSWLQPAKQALYIYRQRQANNALRAKVALLTASPKIVYALTPPATLSNIGDQAQVVAIEKWLAKHFPEFSVLEVDKNEAIYCQDQLKSLIKPGDIIFLHSGGNLGDRGIWSETGRRLMIKNFPGNRIISLPQTIYFSDTEKGRKEKEVSKEIYARHPQLTVIGRDSESENIASDLFPNAEVLVAPDFVLSLTLADLGIEDREANDRAVLACLRRDGESIFSSAEREQLAARTGYATTLTDTTLDRPISLDLRFQVIREFANQVLDHQAMVTDRFHGVIFAVICKRPTVVLPTVDHKLTSAVQWFDESSFVALSASVEGIPQGLTGVLADRRRHAPNFNEQYFDPLAKTLRKEL